MSNNGVKTSASANLPARAARILLEVPVCRVKQRYGW
jgi:hypothetical protein